MCSIRSNENLLQSTSKLFFFFFFPYRPCTADVLFIFSPSAEYIRQGPVTLFIKRDRIWHLLGRLASLDDIIIIIVIHMYVYPCSVYSFGIESRHPGIFRLTRSFYTNDRLINISRSRVYIYNVIYCYARARSLFPVMYCVCSHQIL